MELLRSARLSFAVSVGIVLLALWYGGTLWATDAGIRRVEAHTATSPTTESSAPWQAMRFFGDPDAYYWLSFARDLRASGHLRVRHTFADNAPYGRGVHWAQLPIWSLAILSFALERAGGLSPPIALEWAGRLLMPLLGFMFFSALLIVLVRRLGRAIALLTVLPMAISCHYEFHTMRPDHHGFQIAFAVASLLSLLLSGVGWTRISSVNGLHRGAGIPSWAVARRWAIASGICGGMALWLGATGFFFLLFAIAAGTAIALLCSSPSDARGDFSLRPALFRWWGCTGAVTSLFFYLLEYAPSHFSMRLEVNHPLYALCFLGTAECLRAIALWKQNPLAFRRREAGFASLAFLAAAALPTLVLFGPVAWYLPRLPIMLHLHSRFITEFLSPANPEVRAIYLTRIPLLMVGGGALGLAILLFRRKDLPVAYRAPLRVLATASFLLFLLFCWQGRWLLYLPPFFFLLAAFGLAALRECAALAPSRRRGTRLPFVLGLLLLLQAGHAAVPHLRSIRDMLRVERMDARWNRHMLQRNLLLQLKADAKGVPMRLVAPVEMAPAIYYFGVGRSIGSLYWENLDGLTAAAEFLGDPLPGVRACEIARERGITHVLLNKDFHEAFMCYNLLVGKPDRPGLLNTVGGILSGEADPTPPAWLRQDYRLSLLASQSYSIFIPLISRWISFNTPMRIYAIQPVPPPPPPRPPSVK